MAKTSVISNEQIISAIITNGTLKAAAAACGVSERAIYDRMQDQEFTVQYRYAKSEILRRSVVTFNSNIESAINVVMEIMNDKKVNAAVRLQAAQTLLNNADKFTERLTVEEKNIVAADRALRDPFGWDTLGK